MIPRSHTRRSGQSLVEFALLAPAFFFLLIGVLDFGRAGFYYVSIVDLAKQTARYGTAYNTGTGFTSANIDAYIKGQANATTINTPVLKNPATCARPVGPPGAACQALRATVNPTCVSLRTLLIASLSVCPITLMNPLS